jgi:hypothetical protein
MSELIDPHRQARVLMSILAVVGLILTVVGWYRWVTLYQTQ